MKALLFRSPENLALEKRPKPVISDPGEAMVKIRVRTDSKRGDVAIETLGIPASCDICQAIVNAGGHTANIRGCD